MPVTLGGVAVDDRADLLEGGALRVVEQMAVAVRRRRIAVAKQRADQRQAGAAADELGGEAVPEIVDAQAGDAGRLAQRCPRLS